MTTHFGIDTNTRQAGIDMALAAAGGNEWAAVKLGGANVLPLYVAPNYEEQVDSARTAGLKVGHFWVTGKGSIAAQAKYFAANLHDYRDGDALILDNEQLDTNGQIWTDTQAALWLATVRGLKNAALSSMWMYGSSASLFREHGPWPQVKALKPTIWAAAYPGPPDMSGTGLTATVHQFTSSYSVAGFASVDRSKSTTTTVKLFAATSARPTADPKPGKTSTVLTGSPGGAGSNCWKRMQLLAHLGGYTGPHDGHLGVYSWEGIQNYLKAHCGYTGAVDGEPATLTYTALQVLATHWGYTGPHDGDLGRNSWRAIARFLNTL